MTVNNRTRQSPVSLRYLVVLALLLLSQNVIPVQSFLSKSHHPHQGGIAPMTKHPKSSSSSTTARWKSMFSRDGDLEGADKFKACVPYILPILDGDHFGQYIYERIPAIGLAHDILLGGLIHLFDIFPYLGLVLFVALTLGTRGNTEMNRNVRFSAQQAALIDVSLIVPELISNAFDGEDLPRALVEPCSNFVWYYLVVMVFYCVAFNLRGKKPDQIPYISGWSELMVGPF